MAISEKTRTRTATAKVDCKAWLQFIAIEDKDSAFRAKRATQYIVTWRMQTVSGSVLIVKEETYSDSAQAQLIYEHWAVCLGVKP